MRVSYYKKYNKVYRGKNMIFTKPIKDINFQDVESFCKEYNESVRVEYKADIPDKITKTICAFANTLGGVWIIGVEADKQGKAILPIKGMNKTDGIEDRIINSSLNGIYPSIIPSVRVIDIPGQEGKVVVVVKIQESIEAPHAVDQSTRVYIRTGSQSNPYNLAEIDRIEYFFKRRKDIVDKRNYFLIKSQKRCNINIKIERNIPNIEIVISPLYPYQPIIAPENLLSYSNSDMVGNRNFKKIPGGVVSFSLGKEKYYYFEVNCYGFLYFNSSIFKTQSSWSSTSNLYFLSFQDIKKKIVNRLENALEVYKKSGYSGNIIVNVEFSNVSGEKIIISNDDDIDAMDLKCHDNEISISNITSTEECEKAKDNIINNITKEIKWAFNRG